MGYLHNGHLSLVNKALSQNDNVIVSIFVNPTQFGPNEDLATYPRDINRDIILLSKAGCKFAFVPEVEEIYLKNNSTYVNVEKITDKLEGLFRPNHFRGVTTIVAKLFNIIQPDKAYFGQKDVQQAIVIKRMVLDLNIPVEIIVVPTVREKDGLAMSSRNVYLSPEERKVAPLLYQGLSAAKELWRLGEDNASILKEKITEIVSKSNMLKLEYVSIANSETLDELERAQKDSIISLAAKLGHTRLIDNIVLD